MRTLLGVLVLLVIGVAVLGFYRGWFVISSGSTDEQPSATISVDTDKINADEAAAKENIQGFGQDTKDNTDAVIEKIEK